MCWVCWIVGKISLVGIGIWRIGGLCHIAWCGVFGGSGMVIVLMIVRGLLLRWNCCFFKTLFKWVSVSKRLCFLSLCANFWISVLCKFDLFVLLVYWGFILFSLINFCYLSKKKKKKILFHPFPSLLVLY